MNLRIDCFLSLFTLKLLCTMVLPRRQLTRERNLIWECNNLRIGKLLPRRRDLDKPCLPVRFLPRNKNSIESSSNLRRKSSDWMSLRMYYKLIRNHLSLYLRISKEMPITALNAFRNVEIYIINMVFRLKIWVCLRWSLVKTTSMLFRREKASGYSLQWLFHNTKNVLTY
jgi:hypothetical protein